MTSLPHIGERLDVLAAGAARPSHAAEMLQLGEQTLEHWIAAKGLQPTDEEREGFRILALHRQGSQGDPSFNACRETCRELVYRHNLLSLLPEAENGQNNALMMALVANHLYLFVSGKLETQQLGDFCCSSKPLRAEIT
jgi:hypothetical protein